MRPRGWLNLALLAIAAAIAWWTLGGSESSQDTTPRLLNLDKDKVSHIRIEVGTTPPIDLSRTGGQWRMNTPYEIDADADRIALLLDFLDARSLGTFAASTAELHTYGLDRPGFVLSIDDQRIEFGSQHPYKPARYLRYNGTVHMVADLVTQHLLAGAEAYVDGRLIPAGSRIASIAVPGLTVEQTDNTLRASVGAAGSDTIAQFIEHWRGARAISVRAASHEEQSSTASGAITISAADGTQVNYRIIARSPSLLLLRQQPALVLEVGADMIDSLLKLPPAPVSE
jgi:hypothetical protein